MSDADCTPGREPRSVAASLALKIKYNHQCLQNYNHKVIRYGMCYRGITQFYLPPTCASTNGHIVQSQPNLE